MNMMTPDQLVSLAEGRREAIEREMRQQHLLSQLPQTPTLWQQWTGNGLMWAGAKLVNWGEGMAVSTGRRIEVIS